MTQKDKIDTLIEKEKPNSVFWHFLTGMWYRYFVFGNRISSNKYIIWTSDRYTGSSHPIFNIKLKKTTKRRTVAFLNMTSQLIKNMRFLARCKRRKRHTNQILIYTVNSKTAHYHSKGQMIT